MNPESTLTQRGTSVMRMRYRSRARRPMCLSPEHGIFEVDPPPRTDRLPEDNVTTTPRDPRRLDTGRPPTPNKNPWTRVSEWLAQHSVPALRISLGLVIAGFGVLKFIPGASPAEELVMQTTEVLTFGAVSGTTAVVMTAMLETYLGLTLLTGRGLKVGLLVMAGWLGGIMAPIVLFPNEMFPNGFPTLAAQYVLKDVILAAAWAVVASKAHDGGNGTSQGNRQ